MTKVERLILGSLPVRYLIRKSKSVSPPGFEGLPLYDVAVYFLGQMRQVGLNERAAAISFNFLMAIPPLSIFVFTLLSNLPGSRKLYAQALELARQLAPDKGTYAVIRGIMDDFFVPGSSLLSFGLILAIYFSSNAMITIMRTFNRSMLHIETDGRNFLQIRWVAIKLTVYIVTLILATTFVMVTQGSVMDWITDWMDIPRRSLSWLVQTIRLLITFLLVLVSIGLIYRYATSVGRRWAFLSPGAVLASVVIIAFSILFSVWVNNFAAYNKVYGSIGSILILMLLTYVNSLVLLIGFELNVSIHALKGPVGLR